MKNNVLRFIIIYVLSIYFITVFIPFVYIQFFESEEIENSTEIESVSVFEPSISVSSENINTSFNLYDYSTNEITQVSYRDFLIGSLAYEMDVSVPIEALKAQTVATFSYYSYIQSQNYSYDVLWDSVSGYNYYTNEYLKEYWEDDYESNLEIIETAVDSVYGQILTYDGSVACSAYFAVSNGQTESAENVWGESYEYLAAVASPYDCLSSSYMCEYSFTPQEIENTLTSAWINANMDFTIEYQSWFSDLSYTTSLTVHSVTVCGYGVVGTELQTALSLPSASFSVEYKDGYFVFTCIGQGDGVGMSQIGAIYMANEGATYSDILLWYFPGTILS